jgi:triacylglycerol lipase
MSNKHPAIFVHGILGFGPKELGPLNYWGSALRIQAPLKCYEASVGPLSSAHDRACELAAQIKGTKVDYGAAHAQAAGHKQEGDDFRRKGFVPDWSEQRPVHLVGHSLGAPTIRCLQHLLEIDYWGWGSNHRWIDSITTISGVSNGSTLTYFFGVDEESGKLNKCSGIVPFLMMIEVFAAATGGILDTIYDFDLDHWGFTRQVGETLPEYFDRLAETNFLWGADNAAYTLSLQGAYADNQVWQTYQDTYYFSYVTEQTYQGWFTGQYYPELSMNPALLTLATYIGHKRFATPPIPTPDFDSSDWWENDGAVSTFSQKYPRVSGSHPVGGEFDDSTPVTHFQPGQWYYKWEHDIDHLDICISPQWDQIGWQKRFYTTMLYRLAALFPTHSENVGSLSSF